MRSESPDNRLNQLSDQLLDDGGILLQVAEKGL